MDIRLASCSLFFHLLILLGAPGSKGSETSLLRLHSMDVHENNDNANIQHAVADPVLIHDKKDDGAHQEMHAEHDQGHSSSHMNHMDPSLIVFFLLDDLKQGKTMPIFFRKVSSSPHFLPKEEADTIPFSLEALQNLLQLYSFSKGSPQAKAMEDTLRQCEVEPIKGETKFCPTSLESMFDFVQGIFGTETKIKVLSTSHLTESAGDLQMYTILKAPEEILAPKMVACHTMPYPYAVFYCHYQESKSKIFKVSLRSDHGERVEAVAVCHMDTSLWSRNHVSFNVLGIEPGSSPVCHFFPADNLVWIPTTPV